MAEPLEVKLLPCPFCSSPHPSMKRDDAVWCGSCLAEMPEHDPDVPNAAARWNTRISDQMAGVDGEVAQAVLAERERCARIAEQAHYATGLGWTPRSIAAAIRQSRQP